MTGQFPEWPSPSGGGGVTLPLRRHVGVEELHPFWSPTMFGQNVV